MQTKNWNTEKDKFSHLPLLQELMENNPDDFRIIYAWTVNTFYHLLSLVKPHTVLQKKDTFMRKSVPAE
jgi:hypothetical protein